MTTRDTDPTAPGARKTPAADAAAAKPASSVASKSETTAQRRMLRREIKYDVGDGNLYRQELAALDITLAVHETKPDGSKAYRVYPDLKRIPPRGTIKELKALRTTYWEDDNPDTVRLLARALHIRPPKRFYAFLPPQLEQRMLKKELEFKHVTDESKIKRTVFAVVPTRDGYDVIVQSQQLYDQ